MRDLARYIALSACWAVTVLLIGACDEEVASPRGLDEPFSMYGILNPRLEAQSVAVSPIEPLLYDYPESIDARLTSTDLQTGETRTWRDSTVVGAVGQVDHIFVADFRPQFGSSHRIEVERSDGALSSVVAHIPKEVDVTSDDEGSHVVHVSVTGEAFHLLAIEALYTVRLWNVVADSADVCARRANTYGIPYTGKEMKIDDGYRVAINAALDHDRVMALYSADNPISWNPGRNGFALMKMQVRLLVAEEAWDPPGEDFDANTLGNPRTMSNVANGFGFVGGGYNDDVGIYPSADAVDATWFFDFMMRPPGDCLDYCICGSQ